MSATAMGLLLVATTIAAASTVVGAGPRPDLAPPADRWVLVQSELDYLPATQRRITLQVQQVKPAAFVEAVAKKSDLTIEVRGELPSAPLLSASFHGAATKDVFTWLAERLPVTFMAKPPNTLVILVNGPRGRTKASGAS